VEIARRDTLEKNSIGVDGIENYIETLLEDIQQNIYKKAYQYREEHITKVDSWEEFKEVLNNKGGFISAHWDGTTETEEKIKAETKATIRCLPLEYEEEQGVCVYSGKPSGRRVLFAIAY
jgi:prolyl-tRNA synthetase